MAFLSCLNAIKITEIGNKTANINIKMQLFILSVNSDGSKLQVSKTQHHIDM